VVRVGAGRRAWLTQTEFFSQLGRVETAWMIRFTSLKIIGVDMLFY
jgi:hypothetical protein